ncbi:MAG: ribonuclease HI family protein [Candidatus Competibacteraceae bacterium]|nr:ribonuclease HI family protein [Candidatus Competibacteraceae bacterium]
MAIIATIFFDGLCMPVNPGGYGAYGYVLYVNKEKHVGRGCLGQSETQTNNRAEYAGLGFALRKLIEVRDEIARKEPNKAEVESLTILGDSMLIISQVTGKWQCKQETTQKARERIHELIKQLNIKDDDWVARWIPREANTEADVLSNEGYNIGTFNIEETRR